MARKRRKKQENKFLRIILIIITFILGVFLSDIEGTYSLEDISNIFTESVFNEVNSNLIVSYLDVGQADSILIENNKEYMLIDAGNNEDGELLVKYFNQKEITNFKYLVGTHPHEDHIGGLDDVINNFDVGTIYMPDAITTTKTFTDVLDAIENKGLTYKVPKIQETFTLGEATLEVIYTGTDTKELNNTSIVLRLVFGETTFLFTGDAEDKAEETILKSGLNIQADVLKIGHHGSKYSTTDEFLNEVNPKYAIISVGEGNSYKHPESIVLNKLDDNNIEVHRTDLEGTIIVTSDGKNITINNIDTNVNG